MTAHAPAIVASELTQRFGPVLALSDVSFQVGRRERIALVGANGAGKSTLLAILATLASPRAGAVTIAGFDVASQGAAVRRHLGILFHSPMVYEDLTPLENLAFFAKLYGVRAAGPRIEWLLRRVGLWSRRFERAQVLSRGYHQRLAIARALVHEPDILLLDEPETGLDTDALQLLDELMLCAPDLTVLAATHRHERIDGWATGRLVLDGGRVVELSRRACAPAPSPAQLVERSA